MDNKTKVKVAVVMGIVILAIIFIFMVVYVKENRMPVNKNIPTKSSDSYSNTDKNNVIDSGSENNNGEIQTLENVVSIGIKDENLVKINSDLKSTVIKKLRNEYSDFCYGDNKVYIVSNNEDDSCSIVEIDLLKGDYPEKTIFMSKDYNSIYNIEYYSGKLYFVSEKKQLIEYSISEEFTRNLTKENEVSNFAIDETSNCMYVSYKPNNENAGIYVLDFTANRFTQIITLNDLAGELILKGNTLVIDVKEFERLYVYNLESNSIIEIGPDNFLENARNHVAFYDNVLLYTNGTTINVKDSKGNSYQDGLYTVEDGAITDISMLDSSKLQLSIFDETGNITRSIVIDLSNGILTEMSETVYSQVVRIK